MSYTVAGFDLPALRDFTLRLFEGEIHGIYGEFGSGKSTAALTIAGRLESGCEIVAGSFPVEVRNGGTFGEPDPALPGPGRVSLVYGEPEKLLDPALSVEGLLYRHLPGGEGGSGKNRPLILHALDAVRLVPTDKMLSEHIGGLASLTQFKLLIAAGLLNRPQVLVIDESSAGLKSKGDRELLELYSNLPAAAGVALVLVSEELATIGAVSDRVTIMYGGQSVESGAATGVLGNARHPYTRRLGESPDDSVDSAGRGVAATGASMLSRIPGAAMTVRACSYSDQCGFFKRWRCDADWLPMVRVGDEVDHFVRCARSGELPTPARKGE